MWRVVCAAFVLTGCSSGPDRTIVVCGRGQRELLRDQLAGGTFVLTFRDARGEILETSRASTSGPSSIDLVIPDDAVSVDVVGVDPSGARIALGTGAVGGDGSCVCLARESEFGLVCEGVLCRSDGETCSFEEVARPEPCDMVGESTILDDSGSCFVAGGTTDFLHQETAGWDDSLVWTLTTAMEVVDNFGMWDLVVAEAGRYTIEAYTSASYAESKMARYEIMHGADLDGVVVDQTAVDGWAPLGDFEFQAGDAQWIRLPDTTGEPGPEMIQLVFDAIRLTRIE
jgi:hypothetical protein